VCSFVGEFFIACAGALLLVKRVAPMMVYSMVAHRGGMVRRDQIRSAENTMSACRSLTAAPRSGSVPSIVVWVN
jgi:hypothetical protein